MGARKALQSREEVESRLKELHSYMEASDRGEDLPRGVAYSQVVQEFMKLKRSLNRFKKRDDNVTED